MAEWEAYYSLEPFGEERDDLRAGIIAATVANVHRRHGQRPYRPADFMPRFGKESREQTWEEQKALAEALARAGIGRIGR